MIAAIYLDGGMEPARAFILRYWEPRSHSVVEKPRNPKSELQEWVAQANGARPEYTIEGREGPDHEPVFTVAVSVPGFAASRATGPSRRAAEEAAATVFLQGIIAIGVALPSSPGFFGVFEAFAVVGLGVYGVARDRAVSWAIGFHILSFIPITVIGLYYFAKLGLHFSDFSSGTDKKK